MSGTALVIPVKATIGAKQRLSSHLGFMERRMLALAMASDTLRLATRAMPASRIVVVAGDDDVEQLARRNAIPCIRDRGSGQSAAVRTGMAWARERGMTAAITIAADCPLASLDDLGALLVAVGGRTRRLVCVPDLAGTGTNAAATRPVSTDVWRFGPNSLQRHHEAATQSGQTFEVLDLASFGLDCDRPEDLDGIAAQTRPTATFHVLRQLGLAVRSAV